MTNIVSAQSAHRTPQEALLCAKAKRQQQMFYLRESEASAAKRSVGTEITPSFCRRILLYLIRHVNFSDLIVFQQHEKSNKLNLGFIGLSFYLIVNVSSCLKSFKR
ncbi:hypothetical protein ACPCXF_21905 [Lysinibacillus agricola]